MPQIHMAHQNWTTEEWKNVLWSEESEFLWQYSDGRIRILRVILRLVAMCGYFLGTHCLNRTAYLTAVADHFLPFVTTVYPSAKGGSAQWNQSVPKSFWWVYVA